VLDVDCAAVISEIFSEVIVAPDFSREALEVLQRRKICACLNFKAAIEASPL